MEWHGEREDAAHVEHIADAVEHRRQSRKDPKSLGQNLYDTVTIIFAYSKHIPNPLSIVSSLASPSDAERLLDGRSPPHESMPVLDNKRQHGTKQTPFTASTSTDATSPNVNGKRLSEPRTPQTPNRINRRPSKVDGMKHTAEVLSNGLRVHKIRHMPNGYGNNLQPQKPSNAPLHETLDGARDGALAEKFRMAASLPSISMPARKPTSASHFEESTDNKSSIFNETSRKEVPSAMPVISHLTCEIMDQLKEEVHHDRRNQSHDPNPVVDYDANRRFRPATAFVNRSLYYSLSDSETLLKSFRDHLGDDYKYSPLPHLDAHCLSHAFRDWNQRNGALVFDSLYEALEVLFRPPPELDSQKSPHLKPSRKHAATSQSNASKDMPGRYLSNTEAAHLVMICIHALTSSVPVGWPHTWVQVRNLRGWGVVIPGAPPKTTQNDDFVHPWLDIVDQLEYEPAIRLATRLLQAIGTRRCYEHMLATLHARDEGQGPTELFVGVERLLPILLGHLTQVEKAALQRKGKMRSNQKMDEDPGWTVTATFMEWLRTVIVKQWDGNVDINKWGSVGTAVTIMTHFRVSSLYHVSVYVC
ncbi:hypothetical protein SLS60_010148 [Paraconiothyrium brasiliense]|uniref:Tachykinin family protein n=1 Tax=Paraconiothyrium brasiliense TaxID=300254 RepID=A0ABR3QQN5_9PLEO